MFQALPNKHQETLPQWCHVYLNNWQSIDFREHERPPPLKIAGLRSAMNCPLHPWQDNTGEQSWTSLDDFGNQTNQRTFSLGDDEKSSKPPRDKRHERYGKRLSDLFNGPSTG